MDKFIDMSPQYRVVYGELELKAMIELLDGQGVHWRDIKVIYYPITGVTVDRWMVMWVPHES